MSILESALERKITHLAVQESILTFKVSPTASRGWPDRVFINKHGVHLYIEFKQAGKKLRKLQEYRCNQMRERGCWVEAIDNVGDGYNVILKLLEARVAPA